MRERILVRTRAALLALGVVSLTAACSQIDTLKPVVGDEIVGVQIAIGEVLLAQEGLEVKTVPVCQQDDDQFACVGETLSGEEITGQTSGPDAEELTVAIAGTTIFKGKVQSVQDRAGRDSGSQSEASASPTASPSATAQGGGQ